MKKLLFIAALGLLCLSSCTQTPAPTYTRTSVENELDRIYYADPDYYLDVLSGSDELLVYIEVSEDPKATRQQISEARKALYQRISSDRRRAQ